MVDFIVRKSGKDYDCNLVIEGDIPQAAMITAKDCDIHIAREEVKFMEAKSSMNTTFRIYDLPPDEEPQPWDSKLKKADGKSLGSISILWYSDNKELKINHLKIDDSARGEGLGSTLLMIAFGLGELAQAKDMGFWIGGGEDTVEWLVDRGVPREYIETTSTGNPSFTMHFSRIDYDKSRVEVKR